MVIGSNNSVYGNGKNTFRGVKREESSFIYWGNKNIRDGVCDMVAIGRQSLADPLLPAKLEQGKEAEVKWCTVCDHCIEFLIRQKPVGCSTYEREYTLELKEIRKEQGALADSEKAYVGRMRSTPKACEGRQPAAKRTARAAMVFDFSHLLTIAFGDLRVVRA